MRQARGAVMRRLTLGPARFDDLVETTSCEPGAVTEALEGLAANDLVAHDGERYFLTD